MSGEALSGAVQRLNITMSQSFDKDLEAVDAASVDFAFLAERLGITTTAAKTFLRYALANAKLMERKQKDYGPKNISEFGAYGCIVRMSDKFERMKNLYGNRRRKAVNESILDSWRDFANYGIIGLMCERKEWPSE